MGPLEGQWHRDGRDRLCARLLGELFRVQKHLGRPCVADDGDVYGLIAGVEPVILSYMNLELDATHGEVLMHEPAVRWRFFTLIEECLQEIELNNPKLDGIHGYRDFEEILMGRMGAVWWDEPQEERDEIRVVLTCLKAKGRHLALIERLEDQGSFDVPETAR